MNLLSRRAVQTPKNPMQMIGAVPRVALAQTLAQLLRPLRAGKESFEQCPQVQSSPADHNGQVMAQVNFLQHLPRLPGIFTCGDVLRGIHAIEKVMLRRCEFTRARLGGPDIKLADHRARITVDDLTVELLRQRQRQRRLSAGRGPKNHYQQGVVEMSVVMLAVMLVVMLGAHFSEDSSEGRASSARASTPAASARSAANR